MWDELEDRTTEWTLEWKIATGKLPEGIQRKRSGIAVPKTDRPKVKIWREMEEKAGINEPLIRLAEVTEPLGMPGNKSIEEVEKLMGGDASGRVAR